jgi:L-threonylcarbamoyladenylate synthase
LPTETVYGLAADVTNAAAVRRIYAIKGRPLDHPLIVHVPSVAHLERYAADVPAAAQKLVDRFWPGPLTIVLRKSEEVPLNVTGGQSTVALRMIDHPLAREILRRFGSTVAAPSANRFGRVSPTTADHVRADLGDDVDLIVDGGPSRIGVESTILDLTGDVPAILRHGAIGATDIAAVVGSLVITRSHGTVRAPGMLAAHYAPRAALVVVEAGEAAGTIAHLMANGAHVAELLLPEDSRAAMRSLYASMRALDAQGFDTIVVTMPADNEANAAVRDRLQRAATPALTNADVTLLGFRPRGVAKIHRVQRKIGGPSRPLSVADSLPKLAHRSVVRPEVSARMALIRSRDTKPELYLRRLLSMRGVRYRLHRRDLPGRPDIYVGRLKLAIFVHGCFWHGHDCRLGRREIKSNRSYWLPKIAGNVARGERVINELLAMGIEIETLWTCKIHEFDGICERISKRYRAAES